MNNGFWLVLMLVAVISVGYTCYQLGRRNASRQVEIDRLEQELASARQRAEQVKAGVNSHFEQSAVLFGALAKDCRAFLDHFSESARDLGLSESQAEDLFEQVARPLLANSPPPAPEQTKLEASAGDSGDEAVAPSDQGEHTSEDAQSTVGNIPLSHKGAVADAFTSGDVPRPDGADRAHEERPEKPAS